MKNVQKLTKKSFDYIIIGSGPSGCVVANRLAQNGRFKVALLEAGESDNTPFIRIPYLGCYIIAQRAKTNLLWKGYESLEEEL